MKFEQYRRLFPDQVIASWEGAKNIFRTKRGNHPVCIVKLIGSRSGTCYATYYYDVSKILDPKAFALAVAEYRNTHYPLCEVSME